MADVEVQPVVEAPAVMKAPIKASKKKPISKTKTAKKPNGHPKYCEMIKDAIGALKERGGSSRQALLRYIINNYTVGDEKATNAHLKLALRAGVKNGGLKQSKGTGASGSFKVGEGKTTKNKAKKITKTKEKKITKPKAAVKPKSKKAKKPKGGKLKKSTGDKKIKKTKAKQIRKPSVVKKSKAAKTKQAKKVQSKKPKPAKK